MFWHSKYIENEIHTLYWRHIYKRFITFNNMQNNTQDTDKVKNVCLSIFLVLQYVLWVSLCQAGSLYAYKCCICCRSYPALLCKVTYHVLYADTFPGYTAIMWWRCMIAVSNSLGNGGLKNVFREIFMFIDWFKYVFNFVCQYIEKWIVTKKK